MLLLVGAFLAACHSARDESINQRAESDKTEFVTSDDPAMLRAFDKARGTLDSFLSRLRANDSSMLAPSLKIKIQDGDAVEYFWVSSPSITGDGYSGVIDNDPEAVRSVRNGETVSFPRSQIYDWTYEDRQSGKTIGNFTACALLAHQSASDAAEFRRTYRIDCDP